MSISELFLIIYAKSSNLNKHAQYEHHHNLPEAQMRQQCYEGASPMNHKAVSQRVAAWEEETID